MRRWVGSEVVLVEGIRVQAGDGLFSVCVCCVIVGRREGRDWSHGEGINCFTPVSVTRPET